MEHVRNERHYGCALAGRGLAEWNAGGVPKGLVKIMLCHSGLLLITSEQQEIFFKVVRMRCWRITALRPVISFVNDLFHYKRKARFSRTTPLTTFRMVICSAKAAIETTGIQN
jgi:hypothetical protein